MVRALRKSALALAAVVVSALAVLGGAATASAAPVKLDGVATKLVTDPETTDVLIDNGIVPLPVAPAWVWPTVGEDDDGDDGFALAYRFPITGGKVDSETLAGRINHSGGLRFVNLTNLHSLKLTDFRIVTTGSPRLTAAVNGNPSVRVPILSLDLGGAEIEQSGRIVRIEEVDAKLTQTAADALNATLDVSFFAEGIDLGQAYVKARVAR
ncbi:MAG TPA: HtaA domain-containing protein [Gaiellaceae bacterium]|jgi:hypothetical protein|nr:HtaA domain-containing protein [Gaiellaceae bacterium]